MQLLVEPPQLPKPLVKQQEITQPVTKVQKPMDTSVPQGAGAIKGLKGIKGSAPIAVSSVQAVIASPHASTHPQVLSPLQMLRKGEHGAEPTGQRQLVPSGRRNF